jgi:hypothetical protein
MFVRSDMGESLPPVIEHTSWRLELSGDQFHAGLELYRKVEPWNEGAASLHDFLVRANALPWGVSYPPSDELKTAAGTFLSLDCALTSLYREHDVIRPLTALLAEFRDCLTLQEDDHLRRKDGAGLVAPKVCEAGFQVGSFFVYGAGLTVNFVWVYPQDRDRPDCPLCIHAASIEFRPTPARTLGRGKWLMPMGTTVMYLLGKQLRSLLRGSPERCLSAKGVEAALSEFKWTKATMLTREQLVAARMEFVRQHPESHDQPRELARVLLKAGYWSDTTQLCVITKQVPGLIASAKS